MHTYLIISNDQDTRQTHAKTLATQQDINIFDIKILETEGTIGIEEVRNLQKQIMLKPLKGESKAVIIQNAHTLTTEAQNALLKTLEEPPNHTYIYLTAENTNNLLPTILSRTSIISIHEQKQFDKQALQEVQVQIQMLLTSTVGNHLKLAESLSTDKQEALSWIEKAIHTLHDMIIEQIAETRSTSLPISKIGSLMESFQEAYRTLKTTNTNSRFTLENLFLQTTPSHQRRG